MKKAVITGKQRTEIVEAADPVAKEDWAVVKVHVAPMCTEYKLFRDGHANAYLGHEAVGEVVEVAQPGRVALGDRVAVMPLYPCGKCALCLAGDYIHCQHMVDVEAFTGSKEGSATYCQYVIKPDWLLAPIPDGVSYEHGGMACCGLGPTFGACELIMPDGFDTVLITGLGPVGLGGVINARYRGARVIGVDANPYRADLAVRLGAQTVLNPADADVLDQLRALTDGLGVTAAIDCSGVAEAQRLCIDALRRKGRMAFVGESGDLTITVSDDLLRKKLTLYGSWHYNLAGTPRIMRVIQDRADDLDTLITHTFPLDQAQDAFELQLTGQCGKVLLKPWE